MWELTKWISLRIFNFVCFINDGAGSRSQTFAPAPAPTKKFRLWPALQHWPLLSVISLTAKSKTRFDQVQIRLHHRVDPDLGPSDFNGQINKTIFKISHM